MESVNYDANGPRKDRTMSNPTEIYNAGQPYRDALAAIKGTFDLSPDERREAALKAFNTVGAKQQKMIDGYLEGRAARREALTAVLFHGGDAFNEAVTRYASASHDELRQVAAVAKRTSNAELLRAVAVTAYETGDAETFHDLIRGGDPGLAEAFEELADLGDEAEDASTLRLVAIRSPDDPYGPGREAIFPSQVDAAAEHQRRVEASTRALGRQGNAMRVVRVGDSGNPIPPRGTIKRQVGGSVSEVEAPPPPPARRHDPR